jgi:hypothetical protein
VGGFWSTPEAHDEIVARDLDVSPEDIDSHKKPHHTETLPFVPKEGDRSFDEGITDTKAEKQWNDVPENISTRPVKKDKKDKKQNQIAAWDFPENNIEHEAASILPAAQAPVPRGIIENMDPVTPKRQLMHDIPTLESPLSRSANYSVPRALPAVLEEDSPRQSHINEKALPRQRSREDERHVDDINRDSAFVSGSPIPPQRPFVSNQESVRDSGVHLREWSPAPSDKKRQLSGTDAALERLSWPSVDEDTETVDLKRSQRPQMSRSPNLSNRSPKLANKAVGLTATALGAGLAAGAIKSHDNSETKRDVSRGSDAAEIRRLQTPDHPKNRPGSVGSLRSSTSTPPLRRSDRKLSGDLRSLSQRSSPNLAKDVKEAERSPAASIINDSNPIANEGRVRVKDMADVFVSANLS